MACKCFKDLVKGNLEFVNNHEYDRERRETATGQNPCSVVVTCSDSRVSAPIIFSNTSLGSFFEVETAGQTLGANDIESIKYAVTELGAKLVVVLGHTNCGAVKSTIESLWEPKIRNEFPAIVNDILPSVLIEMRKMGVDAQDVKNNPKLKEKLLEKSIIRNAIDQAQVVAFLMNLKCNKEVIPGVYNIRTGKVKWLQISDCIN